MASTTLSTQPADDDQIVVGSCLTSTSSKYLVQSILGQGSFSTVAKCARVGDNQTVAIKIMKTGEHYEKQSQAEVKILGKLRRLDPDKCNIVRWYQVFSDRRHTCLMFEELDKSLYDFMCQRRFQPLPLKDIRTVVMQIANALNHLKAIGIVHADLKLENVMLVNHAQVPYRVKVVDFGIAGDVSSAKPGAYIQSRPYRAPEIILGLPFTQAIDMWSLGCIAATLCLGALLYPGKSEYDVIKYIVETQGQPSDHLLSRGRKTRNFFQRDEKSTTCLWKLKTPEQFHRETKIFPTETRRIKLASLDDLRHIRPTDPDNPAERIQLHTFVDMLKGMLHIDPTKRLSPRQVLEYLHSSTWNNKDQTNSIQDSTAVKSHPPQPLHHENTHPSTSGQTQSYIGTGIKRKMPDSEDLRDQQTDSAHNDKPHDDRKRFQKSYVSPSTSRSSSGTQSCVLPGIKRKTPHDEDSDSDKRSGHETNRVSDTSRPTCSSSSNFSTHTAHVPDQMKRKMADIENVRHQQTGSDHFVTSHNDRRKFQESYVSPSTSRSSSGTQSCVLPGIKRKTPHDEDSDSDKRSGHETNRARASDTRRPTCNSSSNFSTHTVHVPDQMKRKMADIENVRHQQTGSDHFVTPHNDRRKFQESYRSPSTSRSSSRTQSCVLPGIKRKTPHDEDSDSDKRSGHETNRARASDTSRPTCSSSSNFSTHTAHIPDQMKRKMADIENVRHQQTGSDHFVTSHNDRRKFQESYVSPSTSRSSSGTQSCVLPGIKRKTPHDEDSDSDKRSGHETNRARASDTRRPTCNSSSNFSTHTVHVPDQMKRKMADIENVRHQQTGSDHFVTPHNDRRKFQESYRSPSTSRSSSRTQSCVLPGIKRKTPHDEDSDSDKRSGHETNRARASDTSRPTCSSSSNFSTHTAHIPDQMKRKMADIENVRHQQTGSDHFVTSHNDRRKFQESYRSPSTLCSSSSQTQKSISPGVKRKMPDSEDLRDQQTDSAHNDKPHDNRKRFRKSYVSPSTSRSSSGTQVCLLPGIKRMTPHDEDAPIQVHPPYVAAAVRPRDPFHLESRGRCLILKTHDKSSGHERKRIRESD